MWFYVTELQLAFDGPLSFILLFTWDSLILIFSQLDIIVVHSNNLEMPVQAKKKKTRKCASERIGLQNTLDID